MTIHIQPSQAETNKLMSQFEHASQTQQIADKQQFEMVLAKLNAIMENRLQALLNHLQTRCPQEKVLVIESSAEPYTQPTEDQQATHNLAWQTPNNKTLKKSLQTLVGTENQDSLATELSNLLFLSLIPQDSGEVSIDFLHGKKAHRRQFGGGMGQHLVRAMGRLEKQSHPSSSLPTVLDATAGLGGDSFVLANLGFSVQMVERDGIVSALLADALQRAQSSHQAEDELAATFARMSLVTKDSRQYLLGNPPKVDTIYMDPMYPEKKKSAATKKEMAALQQRLGPDLDSELLLDAAIKTANYRVVVKRPKGAPVIEHPNYLPTTEIKSPNTRYDIYVIKALKTK